MCSEERAEVGRHQVTEQLDSHMFSCVYPHVSAFPFPPGEAARSASLPADLAGASCTSKGLPWSCQTTTPKVRPVMSTRRSRHSQNSRGKPAEAVQRDTKELPHTSLPWAAYRLRKPASYGAPSRKSNCVLRLSSLHILCPASG